MSQPTKKEAAPTTPKPGARSGPEPRSAKVDMHANEGEGSTTAARNYDEATRAYIKSGKSGAAAEAAAKAVDGPEGDSLRAAEKVGKSRAADAPTKR